jgi:dihydrofolate synthase / folylpolyglutamate synthase
MSHLMSQSINLYNQLAKNKLFSKSINFDLKRIKLVLKKLGSPEKKLSNVINIIGSDGKYSLLTSLKYFFEANNQKTSAYISPSLKDIRERFWMGDSFLSYDEIKKTIKIIERQKIYLTIFEVLTVIFILNAAKKNNVYNLIEAGALFAKDSTNVFDFPKIQAVVNINKQHLNFLKKKTLNEVIYQKVGFLNNFTNIYIGKQKSETLLKIKKYLKKNYSITQYPNSWKLIKYKKNFFYEDKKIKIKLTTKYIHSKGLLENLCLAIKIALDLKVDKKIIINTIPKIKFQARLEYINKGKLIKKITKNEKILIDGCHSETSAINLAEYLKTIKIPIYGIWGMTINKEPEKFIKKFEGIFKKIITIPIEGETSSFSNKILFKIAKKNNYVAENSNTFDEALKMISSKEKKLICIFGSLYLCGNILKKN